MIKVTGIKCLKCKDVIYSRAPHDWHQCSCKSVFVDGGLEYLRYGGSVDNIEVVNLEVGTTKQELYDDWNKNKSKYGLIKP